MVTDAPKIFQVFEVIFQLFQVLKILLMKMFKIKPPVLVLVNVSSPVNVKKTLGYAAE